MMERMLAKRAIILIGIQASRKSAFYRQVKRFCRRSCKYVKSWRIVSKPDKTEKKYTCQDAEKYSVRFCFAG